MPQRLLEAIIEANHRAAAGTAWPAFIPLISPMNSRSSP